MATKLKPLAELPLSTQLDRLTGKCYTVQDFRREGNTVIEIETGHVFEFATQAEEEAFKAEKKRAEEAEAEALRTKYDNHPNVIIDLHNEDRWREGLKLAESDFTTAVEMTGAAYWHFLECVPPKRMERGAFVCGEPYTHNDKGEGVYLCGREIAGKHIAQYGTLKQFDNRELFKRSNIDGLNLY